MMFLMQKSCAGYRQRLGWEEGKGFVNDLFRSCTAKNGGLQIISIMKFTNYYINVILDSFKRGNKLPN